MLGTAQVCFYGCSDTTASSQAQADEKLQEAMQTLETSSQGYIPEDDLTELPDESDPSYNRVLDQFQQTKRDESAEQLAAVIADGSPAAKVGALRLRADIHASNARSLTREAMSEWASLAAKSANLLTQSVLVSQATSRMKQYDATESYLQEKLIDQRIALQEGSEIQLGGGESERRSGVNELTQAAKERQAEIDDLESRIAKFEAAQEAATTKAEKHSTDAFTQTGQEQHDSALAAIQARRVAAQNAAEAEKLGVKLQIAKSQLSVINNEIRLGRERLAAIEEDLGQISQREQERRTSLTAAKQEQVEAADLLRRKFQEINAGQNQLVGKRLEAAIELFDQAVADLTQAQAEASKVSSTLSRSVSMDLLSARIGKVRTMYQYVLALGGYGETMQNVVDLHKTITGSPDSETYAETAASLATRQELLINDLQEEANTAVELAEQLQTQGSATEGQPRMVDASLARLRLYSERLKAAKIGSTLAFPEEPKFSSEVDDMPFESTGGGDNLFVSPGGGGDSGFMTQPGEGTDQSAFGNNTGEGGDAETTTEPEADTGESEVIDPFATE